MPTLPATFKELTTRTKYHIACALFRDPQDGELYRKAHHNPHQLKLYLEHFNLDPNIFQRHYKLKFNNNK